MGFEKISLGGGSGGGLDGGELVVVVLSLDRGIGSGLRVWIFILRSDLSPATGGGSGGGLVRGYGLGSEGDSRGADGVDVLGLVRGVTGSPRADLEKEEAVSNV